MEKLYSVANYFIDKGNESGLAISQMKLQKLVYLSQGWNLAINDESLFNDEVQAWKFGPVIPTLYHETKEYGSRPIKNKISEVEVKTDGTGQITGIGLSVPEIEGKDSKKLLDKVWNTYANVSAIDLSRLTHQKDSPWAITIEEAGGFRPGLTIKTDTIRDHYKKLAQRRG